jgi:hypothetical protein
LEILRVFESLRLVLSLIRKHSILVAAKQVLPGFIG